MQLKARYFIYLSLVMLGAACQPEQKFDPASHFKNKCSICHENKEMQRGPNIYGLDAKYLSHQMKLFQQGIRGKNQKNKSEALMGSVVETLPPVEHHDILAKWISDQNQPPKVKNLKGEMGEIKAIAEACVACHQKKDPYPAPDLLSLEPWYLLDQLRKFKSGLRGYHTEDHGGRFMQVSVQGLKDKQLKQIVLYLQSKMPDQQN